MKKKVIFLVLTLVFCIGCFNLGKLFKHDILDNDIKENTSLKNLSNLNTLSMMLETEAGSGEYTMENRSSWPTKDDGYVFNEELSKCENGGSLSFDEETSSVVMGGVTSDKCYVYFDVYVPPTIADTCSNEDNLASCVKTFATTYNSNITSIYYHDSNLTNGAGDNSYRYAGASDSVNNFVCFGSDATTCPDDSLYRIIGVFGNQVKLIKWDYATSTLLGTDGDNSKTCSEGGYCAEYSGTTKGTNTETQIGAYYWNYANRTATYSATGCFNIWSYSLLNTVNINTNFVTNIGATWANKIADTTWIVGGNTDENIYNSNAQTAYINEIVNPDTTIESTYNAKIGLMYTNDYGFAASPGAWTTNLGSYSSYINDNWMYMGLDEWTIVRSTLLHSSLPYYSFIFIVSSSGNVGKSTIQPKVNHPLPYIIYSYALGVRPVFYLNSNVAYVSGSGSKLDPIRIN